MISRPTRNVPKEGVLPRLLYSDSRCSQACSQRTQACGRRSQACPRRSQVLPGLWSALPGAPRYTWRPLHRSSKLRDLTTLGFWSDNSQTLPEAPSDQNTFCWWRFQKLRVFHQPIASSGKLYSSPICSCMVHQEIYWVVDTGHWEAWHRWHMVSSDRRLVCGR